MGASYCIVLNNYELQYEHLVVDQVVSAGVDLFKELGLLVLREHDLLLGERSLELTLVQHAIPVAVVPAQTVCHPLRVSASTCGKADSQISQHQNPSARSSLLEHQVPRKDAACTSDFDKLQLPISIVSRSLLFTLYTTAYSLSPEDAYTRVLLPMQLTFLRNSFLQLLGFQLVIITHSTQQQGSPILSDFAVLVGVELIEHFLHRDTYGDENFLLKYTIAAGHRCTAIGEGAIRAWHCAGNGPSCGCGRCCG